MSALWGRWATARRPRRCRTCNFPIRRHARYWSALLGALPFCAPVCASRWGR